MKFNSDIDIDFANRDEILKHIDFISASIIDADGNKKRHNTGVYVTDIPYDPVTDMANIDYLSAENRGYVKLDFLNVYVYKMVKNEQHLVELMRDPDWDLLLNKDFFEKVIHIGKHYDVMMSMPEKIDSIARMAMFLSIIRPGKRHLVGKTWKEVAETVWNNDGDGYQFKKSHSIAYAHLVVVHINLLSTAFSLPE